MFKSNISEAVSKFLERKDNQENKIKSKISGLDQEIAQFKKEVEAQQDLFVKYDLSDNFDKQENVRKALSELNAKITDLEQRKSAFLKVKYVDPNEIKEAINIKEAAVKEISEIWSEIKVVEAGIQAHKNEIKKIEAQIDLDTTEVRSLENAMSTYIPIEIGKIAEYLYKEEDLKKCDWSSKKTLISGDLRHLALYDPEMDKPSPEPVYKKYVWPGEKPGPKSLMSEARNR